MINQTEINALTAKREEITYCRFNQDCTCLVVGTKILGFYIYKLSPLQLIYSSASDSSEPMHCVCVEMCYTSNIMAIVQTPAKIAAKKDQGPLLLSPVISKPTPHNFDRVLRDDISSTSGRRSDYTVRPLTKKDVMMFDAQRKEGVYIISLAQKVQTVRMNLRAIAVVTKHQVYLYSTSNNHELIQRLTLNYHMGRVLLTNNEKEQYPFMFYSNELDRGLLTIYNLDHNKKHREILAHKSAVMTIATNAVGDIVATTSTYGEVIRLWSTMNGLKLCSFEKSRASVITSLCISRSSKFITACDNESNLSVFRIPLESILAFNEPAQEMEMEMTPLEQQTPLQDRIERESFISAADDIETFENLGNFDNAMLIAQKTPEKETPKMLPPYERLDAKVMKWASAQFACFGPLMQGYFDITQAQTPFSSVQVPTQGDPSKHWMIVGEIPVEADRSVVYAFNRADGMVHSFNAYGAVRQQGEPEQWELVPDKTESIYDLK